MHFKQTKRNVKPETWKTESASPFIHANLKVEKSFWYMDEPFPEAVDNFIWREDWKLQKL